MILRTFFSCFRIYGKDSCLTVWLGLETWIRVMKDRNMSCVYPTVFVNCIIGEITSHCGYFRIGRNRSGILISVVTISPSPMLKMNCGISAQRIALRGTGAVLDQRQIEPLSAMTTWILDLNISAAIEMCQCDCFLRRESWGHCQTRSTFEFERGVSYSSLCKDCKLHREMNIETSLSNLG
jgi:hypothetical protein